MNLMIDLEIMGSGSNAAIVAIGAVKFDESKVYEEFYQRITLKSSVNLGLDVDPETILWWMRQSDEARKEIVCAENNISEALDSLCNWINDKDVVVWGNGSDFDNVIFTNAYKKANKSLPWKFWNNRCYRTVKNLFSDVPMQFVGTKHNALTDAKNQALHLIEILKKMKQ